VRRKFVCGASGPLAELEGLVGQKQKLTLGPGELIGGALLPSAQAACRSRAPQPRRLTQAAQSSSSEGQHTIQLQACQLLCVYIYIYYIHLGRICRPANY